MNLLADSWLPVRRRSSAERIWISPIDLTSDYDSDPVVALDAPRPDFNGALMQFLIGLLQTVCAPEDEIVWEDWLEAPPEPKALAATFETFRAAFQFGGPHARFAQDLTLTPQESEPKPIAALLIEAPGAQALERNTDHFVKRGFAEAMCWPCAAAALFTLHTNAPSGGAGHRTSLRGGGPLTTLVVDRERSTLWRNVWLNVLPREVFLSLHPGAELREPYLTFPWLAKQTAIQPEGGETTPGQVHPLQVYWAMPRRIRLDLDVAESGECAVCGESGRPCVRQYHTKNYGLNYKGAWRHPLSPYVQPRDPGQPPLPIHPQPGGIGYRHWLGWVLGSADGVQPAEIVRRNGMDDARRLWAFGYDMDNMKARGWQEGWLPLFLLPSESARDLFRDRISRLLEAANLAVSLLRSALKTAWFAAPSEARGDYGFVDAAFWSATERGFYEALERIHALVSREDELTDSEWDEQATNWRKLLARQVMNLFERFADGGEPAAGNLHRRAAAYRQLRAGLDGRKMCESLGLSVPQPARRSVRAGKGRGEGG